jgi:hypothetical protein
MGIPFCKTTWDTFCKNGVSGQNVINSIGIDIREARFDYPSPRELFLRLAEDYGIAFLNISYYCLNGTCRKSLHRDQLILSESINQPILQKSDVVILCGEAYKHSWFGKPLNRFYKAVHPDTRCKISKHTSVKASWYEWWTSGAIANKFGINTNFET